MGCLAITQWLLEKEIVLFAGGNWPWTGMLYGGLTYILEYDLSYETEKSTQAKGIVAAFEDCRNRAITSTEANWTLADFSTSTTGALQGWLNLQLNKIELEWKAVLKAQVADRKNYVKWAAYRLRELQA